MNKRGFLRTLEAVIAVIIVFLFIYYAGRSSDKDARFVQGIRSLEESILNDISKNDAFRECIVTTSLADTDTDGKGKGKADVQEIGEGGRCPDVKKFIEGSLPSRYKDNYAFTVCDPKDLGRCTLPNIPSKEVYTSAVIISSSLSNGQYSPRILRIWLY